MPTTSVAASFGDLLKHLRRRAHMTQGELAALVGFSISQISLLEKNERLPDLLLVRDKFAPALALNEEPRLLQRLLELAAQARGESLPMTLLVQQTVETTLHEEIVETSGSLPAPLTLLLGRDREINNAAQRVMNVPGRLLTLVGPPGVGKTRLALAIAEQLQPLFADGTQIVELSAINDPAYLASAMLDAIGVSESSSKPAAQRLLESLRRSERLIVLDNFEQLLSLTSGEAGDVSATRLLLTLLGECPNLRLLVTSREPLRLRAEQRYKVQPLELAAAIELFLQRAQAVDPEMVPSAPALAAITEICQRLDCLPLAIELLAARSDLLSPQAMLTRLKDRSLDWLSDGPSDLPPQHRTLRVAIQRSYALLSTAEQQLFRRLGVFVGGFDLSAVEQLHDPLAVTSVLQSLIAKSLVKMGETSNGERRYQLLETLRDYALEQLATHDEEATERQRHAHYFLALAEQIEEKSLRHGNADSLAQFQHDHENLRAALQWLLAHDVGAAQQMVGAMRRFWYTHGYLEEGRTLAQQAVALSAEPSLARAAALLALGQMTLNQGKSGEAQKYLHQALTIFESAGTLASCAQTQIELGWAVYLAHQPTSSMAHFRNALALAEQLNSLTIKAHALTSLTHVMVFEGSYTSELKEYIEESIELCRQLGDAHNVTHALLNLSAFYTHTGDYAAAIQILYTARESADASSNSANLGWVYAMLAELLLISNQLAEVESALDRALRLFQSSSNNDGITMIYHHRGELARKEERWTAARLAFTEGERLARAAYNERVIARCLMGLGRVALATGQSEEASRWVGEAWAKLSSQPVFLPPAVVDEYRAAFLTIAGEQ